MAEGTVMVQARDLTVRYPRSGGFDAVRGVDLRLEPGEILGVVGEAGAGKSTLARILAGRAARGVRDRGPRVAGGRLDVLGFRADRPSGRVDRILGARVGYLPQQAGRLLVPGLTIAENVTQPLFLRDRRFDRRDAGARAAELIDAVQLPLLTMSRYPWELSAGQRQRVAIARSLILQPTVWIADEPTSSVDVTTRGPVLDTVLELHGERVFSAVIVSHEAAFVQRRAHRVLVLHRGVAVATGTVDELFTDPAHPYVRGLLQEHRLRTEAVPGTARSFA